MEQANEDALKESSSKLEAWRVELTKLETLGPIAAERKRLIEIEIPELNAQIADKDGALSASYETLQTVSIPRSS